MSFCKRNTPVEHVSWMTIGDEGKKHTKVRHLPPVPVTEVVIKGIAPRTRSHLLCASSHGVYVGPSTFWCLAIRSGHPFDEIEREIRLTRGDVGGEVKFRYKKCDYLAGMRQMNVRGIPRHALPKVLVPLTCDVVRDVDDNHLARMRHRRKEQIVHIDISNLTSLATISIMTNYLLLPLLEISNC